MTRVVRALRSPVLQFALSGALAVALIGVLAVGLLERAARSEALWDARVLTRVAARGVVAPALTSGVLRGDPRALARLDTAVSNGVLRDPIVRVKLWAADGRIVYSDEPRLIGARYPLEEDERGILRHGGTAAELSDADKPENRYERGLGDLREVYTAIRGPDGRPLLFETYERDSAIAAGGTRVWKRIAPILIATLVLLELVQLPLAISLVRRLDRGRREREALLLRAVSASEAERRRIAQDLHDGPVQDLVGVSFRLAAAPAGAAGGTGDDDVRDAGEQVRETIRRLRTMSIDLYPDALRERGLLAALEDVARELREHGLDVELTADDAVRPTPDQATLVVRVAREAARNVIAHADARHVTIAVRGGAEGGTTLDVVDDGRGPTAPGDDRPRLGLRIVEDLAREQGGTVGFGPRPDGAAGGLLRLELPGGDA